MSSAVFADTYYYLALCNPRDAAHPRAVAVSRQFSRSVVTSAWVIQELADALAAPPARASFLQLFASLEEDSATTIILPDPAFWRKGLELYRSRPDKAWSLTDCISFEILRENGITEALTADRHFEQAGFAALLKPPC